METWRKGQPKRGRSEGEEGRLSEDEETGVLRMVRDRGFEPLTPSVSRRCSTTEPTAPWNIDLNRHGDIPQDEFCAPRTRWVGRSHGSLIRQRRTGGSRLHPESRS